MKAKTSELIGPALDWAVAKCEKWVWEPTPPPYRCFECKYYEERQGRDDPIQYCHHPASSINDGSDGDNWSSDFEVHSMCPYKTEFQVATYPTYSTDWAQGGPIIEREGIGHDRIPALAGAPREFCAWQYKDIEGTKPAARGYGPTPLIAAMRCYVASKMGDEVDMPEGI